MALQSPYLRPHAVINSKEKKKLYHRDQQQAISIDRLKPAHILPFDESTPWTPSPDQTRADMHSGPAGL